MALDHYWVGFSFGQLDAYIDMIKRGVKEIATPNLLFERNSLYWNTVDYKVKSEGLSYMNIDYLQAERSRNIFRKVIFVPDKKQDAKRIIELFMNKKRTKDVHRELGQLFGYSQEKIENFIEK